MEVLNFYPINISMSPATKSNSNFNNPLIFHHQHYYLTIYLIQTNKTKINNTNDTFVIKSKKFKQKAIINPNTIINAIMIPTKKSICNLN